MVQVPGASDGRLADVDSAWEAFQRLNQLRAGLLDVAYWVLGQAEDLGLGRETCLVFLGISRSTGLRKLGKARTRTAVIHWRGPGDEKPYIFPHGLPKKVADDAWAFRRKLELLGAVLKMLDEERPAAREAVKAAMRGAFDEKVSERRLAERRWSRGTVRGIVGRRSSRY